MVTVLQTIYNENSPRMVTVLQIIYAATVSNRNNCSNDAMVTVAGAVTICDYHCKKNTHGHQIMEEKQQSTDAQCLPWMESCQLRSAFVINSPLHWLCVPNSKIIATFILTAFSSSCSYMS